MEILNNFNTSVEKALEEIDQNWRAYDGLIIAGSWPGENDESVVEKCKTKLREAIGKGMPILGICLGHQVIGLERGCRLEKLSERNVGIHEVSGWWGNTYETFWHDYVVVDENGYKLNSFRDNEKNIIGVQFHPEYQSSPEKPHPILVEFIEKCKSWQKQ